MMVLVTREADARLASKDYYNGKNANYKDEIDNDSAEASRKKLVASTGKTMNTYSYGVDTVGDDSNDTGEGSTGGDGMRHRQWRTANQPEVPSNGNKRLVTNNN